MFSSPASDRSGCVQQASGSLFVQPAAAAATRTGRDGNVSLEISALGHCELLLEELHGVYFGEKQSLLCLQDENMKTQNLA